MNFAWRATALAGVVTLVLAILFGRIEGLQPCGPSDGAGAILAFEFARTAEQVQALFGSEPCTSSLIAAQRKALWLDLLGFIPAYVAFFAFAAGALQRTHLILALGALSAAMLAGAFDLIEGVIMLQILGEMPGTERLFAGLAFSVNGKFALLGLAEILLGLLLWRGALLRKIAAGPMLAGGLVSLILLVVDPLSQTMMKAHSYAWIALLLVALVGAFRPAMLEPWPDPEPKADG